MQRHMLVKLTKIKHKEQILKAAKENQQIIYKDISLRMTLNSLRFCSSAELFISPLNEILVG